MRRGRQEARPPLRADPLAVLEQGGRQLVLVGLHRGLGAQPAPRRLGVGRAGARIPGHQREHLTADVVPGRPATTLVTNGPYRVTRNPIYIGFILLYFGIAILATSVWMLLLLVPLLIVLQRGVVEREETYLDAKFGEEYGKYKARAPRWL